MEEKIEIKNNKLHVTKYFGLILVAVTLIVGLLIGGFFNNLFEKEKVTTAYVSGKLDDMGELTTQKLTYSGIYEVSEGEIPIITQKGFSMWYNAEVEAFIDFEDVDIDITRKKVTIKIPHAKVKKPEILEDSINFVDNKRAIFNWTKKSDITKAITTAENKDLEKMDFSMLTERADEHAEILLTKIFEHSIGRRTVEIVYK